MSKGRPTAFGSGKPKVRTSLTLTEACRDVLVGLADDAGYSVSEYVERLVWDEDGRQERKEETDDDDK